MILNCTMTRFGRTILNPRVCVVCVRVHRPSTCFQSADERVTMPGPQQLQNWRVVRRRRHDDHVDRVRRQPLVQPRAPGALLEAEMALSRHALEPADQGLAVRLDDVDAQALAGQAAGPDLMTSPRRLCA
jgi:hypothetical protein